MRPTSLEVNGLLSYRNYQHLDLSSIEFAAIVGENGAGKSSILDCMMFALFGSVEGNNLDLILTTGVDEGSATLEFTFDGFLWRVTRTRVRNKRTAAQFARWDDAVSEWEIVTDGSVRAVDQEIQRLLRVNEAAFRATVMLAQNEASSFSSATPAERKEILGRIVGLDRYSRLATAAKLRADEARNETKTKTALLGQLQSRTENEDTLRRELSGVEEDVVMFEKQREEGERLALDADEEKRAKEKAVDALRSAIEAKRELLAQQKAELEKEYKSAAEERTGDTEELGRLKDKLAEKKNLSVDIVLLRETIEEQETKSNELASNIDDLIATGQAEADESKRLAVQKAEQETNLLSAKERRELLTPDSVSTDGRCWVCDSPLDEEHRRELADDVNRLIDELEKSVADAQRACGESETKVADLRKQLKSMKAEKTTLDKKIEELRDKLQKQDALSTEIEVLESQITAQVSRCAKSEKKFEEWSKKREAAGEDPQLVKAVQKLEEAETQLEEIQGGETHRAKAAHAAAQVRSLSNKKAVLVSKIKQIEDDKKAQVILEGEISGFEVEERKFTLLRKAFGRDGIPALIYAGVVVELNEHINSILGFLSDGQLTVELVTTKETKKGTLNETLDVMIVAPDGARPYSSFSGGEKFRIDIALRLGLSRLLANRHGAKMEFLAIDEGWGALDPQGISAMISELNKLRGEFSLILTVTHIDAIREGFGTLIHVTKTAGGSEIEVE